jgi:pimeloyl-ACP methyl ester carboxylesterase
LYFPWFLRLFVNPKIVRAFVETPLPRLLGLSRMMFDWAYRHRSPEDDATIIYDKPMLQIHGTNDWLVPIRLTNPDVRIEGAGHLLSLTHHEEVNELIRHFLDDLSDADSESALADGFVCGPIYRSLPPPGGGLG